LNGLIRRLRGHRAAAQATIDQLDRAIEALSQLGGKALGRPGGVRHMPAEARKRIADAQRARRARIRAVKGKGASKAKAAAASGEAEPASAEISEVPQVD